MPSKTFSKPTVLVTSAHPDDAEIGMGGTIAKLVEGGSKIISVVITDGRRSPNPLLLSPQELIQMRMQEARQAAGVLGISDVIFFGLPDLKQETNIANATGQLEDVVKEVSPAAVYTLHPDLDRHETHRRCGELTRKLVSSGPELWAYEVWGLFPSWDRMEDISKQIETKIRAIEQHRSQTLAIPYDQGIRGLNRWRGVFADPSQQNPPCEYAEVFLRL